MMSVHIIIWLNATTKSISLFMTLFPVTLWFTNQVLTDNSSTKCQFCFRGILRLLEDMHDYCRPLKWKISVFIANIVRCFTHRRPFPCTPLATRAEAGRWFRRAGQVGTVWFISHSSLSISAADITCLLSLATRHRALQDMQTQAELR